MGGVRSGGKVFCNRKCFADSHVLTASQSLPAEDIEKHVAEIWGGNCPDCNGPGPVDLHKSHQVWSALVMTRWSSKPRICCRSCATKRQIAGAASSLIVGWWGVPWGVILTPVQIGRNIVGIFAGPDKSAPSPALRKAVLVLLGRKVAAAQQAAAKQAPPAIPAQGQT
jgi:hypothetical protein